MIAAATCPDHAEAWLELGAAMRAQGRSEQARLCFEKTLAVASDHLLGRVAGQSLKTLIHNGQGIGNIDSLEI